MADIYGIHFDFQIPDATAPVGYQDGFSDTEISELIIPSPFLDDVSGPMESFPTDTANALNGTTGANVLDAGGAHDEVIGLRSPTILTSMYSVATELKVIDALSFAAKLSFFRARAGSWQSARPPNRCACTRTVEFAPGHSARVFGGFPGVWQTLAYI